MEKVKTVVSLSSLQLNYLEIFLLHMPKRWKLIFASGTKGHEVAACKWLLGKF